uniref:Sal-like protein 2 n=1 Tax=Alligator sinensis TaxID=38654 RepID=A0A7D3QN80_ALLSI|nr:spalt-like transcription factor 2 [Alligator sinensis]
MSGAAEGGVSPAPAPGRPATAAATAAPQAPARGGPGRGMSRRKQRKPQQLISDCDGSTASDNGDTGDEAAPSSSGPAEPPPAPDSASSSSSSSSSTSEPRPESPPGMETEPPAPAAPEPPAPPPPPPAAAPPPAPPGGHLNIPLILEELRVLQQRQLHQMQMTEEICRQVLLLGSLGQAPAPEPPAAAAPPPPPAKAPLPVFSIKAEPGRTPASGSPELPKPAFFHLYHPFPRGPKAEPLLAPAFPATGLLAAQCLGASRGLEPAASPGLLRPKNGAGAVEPGPDDKAGGRHKCRFCAKVFGSDSALQIHLRSHTGERPYKCNVCGNRFTTRGNLKVHFHRHREKYPHVQMNPHPVPEHLDYVLTGTGLPYGMSVPPEKAEPGEEPPTPAPEPRKGLSATESLTLLSGAATPTAPQALPVFNKLVLLKAAEGRAKGDENTPPGREAEAARLPLGKLPGWALLAGHFKAGSTGFPFPCLLEPLGASPSETSKLQQLVEKIDRQAPPTPGVGGTAAAAPSPPAPSSSSSLMAGTSPGGAAAPNQCVICLRVLSCPRALRLHYGQHGGERPYRCKVCGRAFSTRGNLRAHCVGHKASPAARAHNSCPICQKKFTNAVTLQQHVRMHLGGQIPNGALLPEPPATLAGEGPRLAPAQPPAEGPALPRDEEELSEEEDEDEEEDDEEEGTDEDSLDSGAEKPPGGSEGGGIASAPHGGPRPPKAERGGGGEAAGGTEEEKEAAGAGVEEPRAGRAQEGAVVACGVCKEAFPDGATLRKHVLAAHHQVPLAWGCGPARRGRRPTLEGPVPVLAGGTAKLQDFLSRDVPAQLVGVGPLSFWNQYTAFVSAGGLASKPARAPALAAAAPALYGPSPGLAPSRPAPAEAKEKPVAGTLLLGPPAPSEPAPDGQGKAEK